MYLQVGNIIDFCKNGKVRNVYNLVVKKDC